MFKKSRKEKPQKLTQLSSRSHPRHLVGKRTAQKDTIIDITSDSQVKSNFPYRWSLASVTLNSYSYQFLYLYTTRITINNNAPHLNSPKNQNRRAALGRPAVKLLGGGGPKQKSRLGTASSEIIGGGGGGGGADSAETSLRLTDPRPCFCFGSPDKTTTTNNNKTNSTQTKSKSCSWI